MVENLDASQANPNVKMHLMGGPKKAMQRDWEQSQKLKQSGASSRRESSMMNSIKIGILDKVI